MSEADNSTTDGSIIRETFEKQRITRRQALRKFGITSAMVTFAMFSVDDLARMVGGVMERNAGDNGLATQVARELRSAGVAAAGSSIPPGGPSACDGVSTGFWASARLTHLGLPINCVECCNECAHVARTYCGVTGWPDNVCPGGTSLAWNDCIQNCLGSCKNSGDCCTSSGGYPSKGSC
jgi:hypothetical protein